MLRRICALPVPTGWRATAGEGIWRSSEAVAESCRQDVLNGVAPVGSNSGKSSSEQASKERERDEKMSPYVGAVLHNRAHHRRPKMEIPH
jgi:hypothetical protein